ncbi:aspartate/glutamate racemase family protein [Humitalea sp. 24SJ18S-53]|uniref:aspartate/glutamate racemase family protein n=1 Tax=Humitalea sp. 24SJ18S-53 TaxID=3422307 RepID=UPI003D67773E
MRLLLLNGNTDPAITDLLARKAAAALPRLGLAGITLVPVTARFGARYIASESAAAIAGHAVLDAVAEHASDVDAIAIACFGDPGLAAAREIFPGPVVGMADASVAAAAALHPCFALLTGGAAWVPMLRAFCLVRGFGPDQALVRGIAPTGDMIARDPATAAIMLSETATQAVEDGAGVVVLGGAGLAGIAPLVAPHVAAPVLDSLDCLLLGAAAARGPIRLAGAGTPSVGLGPALEALLSGGG